MKRRVAEGVHALPDDVPKSHLFTEPIRVARLAPDAPEEVGAGRVRVTFAARVVDATGKGCHDLAVDARVEGPERTGEGQAHTDALGEVFFRMEGPPGRYRCEILGVAAGALELVRKDDDTIATAETTAP